MSVRSDCTIAVYQPNFLSVSMTFIYRQLLGVADEFFPIVLTKKLANENLFPYPHIYVAGPSVLEDVYSRFLRRAAGHFGTMSRRGRDYCARVLVENDARLVHAHFGSSGIEILPVAKSEGLPLLVTFHGADASKFLESRSYVSKLRELFAYAHIIAVSKRMADELVALGADEKRTFALYIGAPLEDFAFVDRKPVMAKKADGETIHFLQVANFIEKKGHAYTLRAFRDFSHFYPNCDLTLAGDGRLRSSMEQLCRELEITDRVRFVGAVAKPEVIRLMNSADVFLHHSVTAKDGNMEGIPTVLMEAMATGLIVFSTFHAGIPELINDGVSGFLVNERDVAGYSEKLIHCLEHSETVGQSARETVSERFDLRKQNEKLKGVYRAVTEGAPSCRTESRG